MSPHVQRTPVLLSERLYSHAHGRVWREHQRGPLSKDNIPCSRQPDPPMHAFGVQALPLQSGEYRGTGVLLS